MEMRNNCRLPIANCRLKMRVFQSAIFIFAVLFLLAGCSHDDDNPPLAKLPTATDIPAERSTTNYWLKQSPVASVSFGDYQKLWDACSQTVVNDQFELDRQDFRQGVLTTWPLISKQFFEVWRSDAGTLHDIWLDSTQTIRRTIWFDFSRGADGGFVATPKVLIEQSSHPERRITTYTQFTAAFASTPDPPTRVTDEGTVVGNSYWYALGRDDAMERELVYSVKEKLGKGSLVISHSSLENDAAASASANDK